MIEIRDRCDIMGVGIDGVRPADVVDHVLRSLDTGRGGRIVTPNVDILRQVTQRRELRPLIDSADIVVADGAPVVWASHLQGTPLPERIAGASMIWTLSGGAARAERSVFLLGGAPGVAEHAVARLRAAHPGLRCGWHAPPFGFERSRPAIRELVVAVAEHRPDIVFCGFGFPKQERLMQRLVVLFPSVWFCAVGAGIAFAAGELPRAPVWMQRSGLEWVHRLAHEPRRLGRRYLVHDLPFALELFGSALARRLTAAN